MRKLILILLAGVITLASLYIYIFSPQIQNSFELKLQDLMLQYRGAVPADERIVIIDLDEKSLAKLGQWPWSRDLVGDLLLKLTEAEVALIGLDVVFAEADRSSPHRVLQDFIPQEKLPNYDEYLAEVLQATPTVLGFVFLMQPDSLPSEDIPAAKSMIIERNKPQNSYILKPYRALLNQAVLQEAGFSSGYFNTVPDSDGLVRSVPLVMEFNSKLYPALGLEILRLGLGEQRITINYSEAGVDSISLGEKVIPTDIYGRVRLNYRGGAYSYKYISAVDVLEDKVQPEDLAGKIALVGTSAAGLLDLRAMPLASVYPGVEVHASLLDNILNEDFLVEPSWAVGVDALTILVFGVLGLIVLLWFGALVSFVITFALAVLLVVSHYQLFLLEGLFLNTLVPLVSLLALFLLGNVVNYFYETRQRKMIKSRFAQKVSPAVVEEIIKNDDADVLAGRETEVTIFFSDIRAFTSISEQMGSPQALIGLLNRYMTPMVEIITQHQGTVDKFIGDSIMAYWNAPLPVEQHADIALEASVKQILALEKLNRDLSKDKLPFIDIGIGLNTGVAVVGEMGSSGRSDYTCIGDSVNLAARAEGLTKTYGAKIVITEFTLAALSQPQNFVIRFLDRVTVKGKTQPVKVYEVLGFVAENWYVLDEQEKQDYAAALEEYEQANFAKALEVFQKLNSNYPQKLYRLYLERSKHYLENPPENFNGVFSLTTK